MDANINASTGASVDYPQPTVESDAKQSHEPSSIDPQSSGSFFWSERASDSPEQVLKLLQTPTKSVQVGPDIPSDGMTRGDPGIGSSDSTDHDHLPDSNQESLTDLLRPLVTSLAKKRFTKKITGKVRQVLKEHPNVDVNELIDGQSILHLACRHGLLQLLDDVLERPNADVNVKTSDGLTVLHIACHDNNVAAVETLLQSPRIDINIRDDANSRTPLHVAAIQGNRALMKMLLDMAGIDLQSRDMDGYLPAHYAAVNLIHPIRPRFAEDDQTNHTNDILIRLCENGAINARIHEGRGLLHLAAQARNTVTLKAFLSQPGLDLNMTDAQGNTALHLVEDIGIAGLLLDGGLNANLQNVDGNTALHSALEHSNTELVQLLLYHTKLYDDMPNKKGEHFMHLAAAKWGIEIFNRAAAASLSRNVNVPAGNGETVLHIAARVGDIDIVKCLLDIPGIDVNMKDEGGSSPLHLSCENGHIGIVQSLLDFPFTHVNARDTWRQTSLHLACKEGHLDIVRLLFASEQIDVDAADLRGWTPLHHASQSPLGEPIVCDLLPFTLDVDKQGLAHGETALHLAALGGHFGTARNLLEQGADPRITCTGLVGSDGANGQDAAGVASKIEIVDLIRHYRWRKVSITPDPLSDSQKTLLEKHAGGVYIFWVWPRTESLSHGHGKTSRRRRRRILPDIRAVHEIYHALVDPDFFDETKWQLRSFSLNEKKRSRGLDTPKTQRATKWVHFSAQSRRWVEDFCRLMYSHESLHAEGVDVLTFLDDTFDQRSGAAGYSEDFYRDHGVHISTLPVVTDKETTEQTPRASMQDLGLWGEGVRNQSQDYSVAAIVIPLIDIDMMTPGYVTKPSLWAASRLGQPTGAPQYLHRDQSLSAVEQAHVDMITSLNSAFKTQQSRSLDHYFHRDLTDTELQAVNCEQVLSRFIHHQQAKAELQHEQDSCTSGMRNPKPSGIHPVWRSIMKAFAKLRVASNVLKDMRIEDGPDQSKIKPDPPRQNVLVVPQLWLWKVDNVLITALPARWESSNLHSAADYIRSRVELRDADESPDKMLHEILIACLEYQPTFSLFGRQLTYQDAFSREISRISRDIDQCYKGFRNDLGKSDDRFLDSFRTATTSLLDIDDVLNELTMIKRVYQNQAQVWEDMHKDRTLAMKCRCSPDQAPRRLYTVMTRLEEDAHKVRESVVTLLQLTQGSASTENALKASEQSKILAIFTVVTVIFTPLSWIAALFALKIESFHAEEAWTSGQVAGGSVICLGGTLVLCALGWKWLNRERAVREHMQARGPPQGRRTYKL